MATQLADRFEAQELPESITVPGYQFGATPFTSADDANDAILIAVSEDADRYESGRAVLQGGLWLADMSLVWGRGREFL